MATIKIGTSNMTLDGAKTYLERVLSKNPTASVIVNGVSMPVKQALTKVATPTTPTPTKTTTTTTPTTTTRPIMLGNVKVGTVPVTPTTGLQAVNKAVTRPVTTPNTVPAKEAWGVAPTAATTPVGATSLQQALDAIRNDPRIPDDVKPIFEQMVQNWDVNQDLNIENVLSAFNKIKTETIDPYYKEQITQLTNDYKDQLSKEELNRASELEVEKINAASNIEDAKANLEARGLTFSGEAIKTLGKDSAYALPNGSNSALPAQTAVKNADGAAIVSTPFGGFYEGSVNTNNRIISSSSSLRYKDYLDSIARAAE
jgi:hypothetical protein